MVTYEEAKAHAVLTAGFTHTYRVFRQGDGWRVFVHPEGSVAGMAIGFGLTKREAYDALVNAINLRGWS